MQSHEEIYFIPEDGGRKFTRNVGKLILSYMASHPKTLHSSNVYVI